MKSLIRLFLVISLGGCAADVDIGVFADDPSIKTLNGTWRVKSFEDFNHHTVEFKTQANSRGFDITVTFDDSKQPHEISGENTTNTIWGEFDYIHSRTLTFSHVASTEVAQPPWADQFMDAILQGPVDYKINATTLRIYYDNDTKSVTLVRI